MTYKKTVGSTWYSKAAAATRAYNEIVMAMSGASGSVVYPDLSALFHDFTYLHNTAMEQASSAYNVVFAQTNTDIQTLWTDCRTTG